MSTGHARLSASGSERWMECPGSIRLGELVPQEDDESDYAAEGSAAHALAEKCMLDGMDTWMFVGSALEGHEKFPVTPEMAEAVQVFLDYARGLYGEGVEDGSITMLVEHTIGEEHIGLHGGGTLDLAFHDLNREKGGGFLHLLDYKHGVGVAVDIGPRERDEKDPIAGFNSQMLYYAYGLLKSLGVEHGQGINTGLTIGQPRAVHEEGPIRERWLSSDDILDWGDNILLPAMRAVDASDAPLQLGSHCRFCPAKLVCREMKENFSSVVEGEVDNVAGMSDEELALEFDRIEQAQMYIKALRDEAFRRAMNGTPVPGTKLVAGRADRQWKDDAEAELIEKFGDDAYNEPKLKSPAQVEKTCTGGKNFVAQYAFKPEPNPMLVSANDRRPAVTRESGAATFANVKT